MALEIKAIPTLRGKEAERFVKEADKAYQNKGKTDFSKQVKIARALLNRANLLYAWDFCWTNAVSHRCTRRS